ncbi:MAG: organomercurial lyase [bacterium]
MNKSELESLTQKLRASSVPTHFSAEKARLLIAVWRKVAEGQAVPFEHVQQIAANLQVAPAAAHDFIYQMSELDENGCIVGIFGLSQKRHPHQFFVNGNRFYTWCAWDALFLPVMLAQSAEIESICPATEEKIQLTVSPRTVEQAEPKQAVLSIVVPEANNEAASGVEQVWKTFCCQVHFFSGMTPAKDWFVKKEANPIFLSLEEGFELGKLAFKELLGFV